MSTYEHQKLSRGKARAPARPDSSGSSPRRYMHPPIYMQPASAPVVAALRRCVGGADWIRNGRTLHKFQLPAVPYSFQQDGRILTLPPERGLSCPQQLPDKEQAANKPEPNPRSQSTQWWQCQDAPAAAGYSKISFTKDRKSVV